MGPPGALSWSRLGGLFGRLGGLLGCLGALLGCLGAVLGASWAVLRQSWGPLGRSWSVGKPKSREPQKPSKTNGKAMIFASWGPLGRPLGGLLRRLGGLLARLGAILGVLEHLGAIFRPLGALLERLGGLLGLSWRLRGPPGCVWELVPPPPKRHFGPQGRGKGGGGQPNVSHAFSPPASGGRRISALFDVPHNYFSLLFSEPLSTVFASGG